MLHILLMILKIIGIIIAVVVGLVLLAVLVLTFAPLKYNLNAKCEGTLETLDVEVRYSWLYRFVSGWVVYREKETSWQFRVAWKKFPEASEKSRENADAEKYEDATLHEESIKNGNVGQMADDMGKETEKKKNESSNISREKTMKDALPKPKEKREDESERPGRIEKLFRKIQYTFQKICDRIKSIGEKKDKIRAFLEHEIHQSAFKKLKMELLRLLRFLRPKKIQGRIHFGYEDPCNTGTTLAWLSICYPFYGEYLTLEPDFHEKVLEGELHMKGKIRGMHAAIVCFHLLRSREIRTTYKHIRAFKL